jgi:hypothetical protein
LASTGTLKGEVLTYGKETKHYKAQRGSLPVGDCVFKKAWQICEGIARNSLLVRPRSHCQVTVCIVGSYEDHRKLWVVHLIKEVMQRGRGSLLKTEGINSGIQALLKRGSYQWLPNRDNMSYSACQIGPSGPYWFQ